MSAILVVSIVLRLTSAGLALYLLARIRDWRIALVAATIGLMAVRQLLTLSGQPLEFPLTFDASWDELPGLAVSVLVFLSLFFIGDLIHRDRMRADSLEETTGVQKIILDTAHVGITMVRDRKIVWANPYFTTMLGWTPEEYRGRSTRLVYPDDETFHRMWPDFQKALKSGKPWDLEMQMRRKDGSLIDTRLVGRAIEPGDPSLGGIWLLEDISEKKRRDRERAALLERLELTVERLKYSQEIAGLASWEYLPRTDTHLWSDELYRALGYEPGGIDLDMDTMLALSHPDDADKVREALDSVITGGADAYSVVHRVNRRDGIEIVVHDHGVPERDEHGTLVRIVGVTQDITEFARAEKALRESEARHRGILANSAVAIASTDAEGTLLYWNTAFERFTGYNAEQLTGMDVAEINHPEEIDTAAENFIKLKQGVIDTFRREKKYRRRDGTTVWGEVSVAAIRDADGNFLQAVAVIADISEKKHAETALLEREALLSTVLERSFDGMVTLKTIRGPDGCVADFEFTGTSGTAVQVLGLNPIGRRFLDLFPTSPETGQFKRYVNVVETGEALDIETQYTGILPGDPWLHMVAVPRDDGFAIAFTDITEAKNAEEALKTAYAEMEMRVQNRTQDLKEELARGQRTQKELEKAKLLAEEASRAKSDFLSRVSHELRTPMNAILGFSQLLQHDTKSALTGDQPQYVHEIMSAGNHLMMLISQLLDMAKIETGNMELSLASTPARPLIEECRVMTQSLADARGVTLRKCTDNAELPRVEVDPLRFKQILLNLMSNAVKYNRDNGEVVVECRETPQGYLRVSVTDQGRGIPADQFDNVFEPFNRAGAENADVPGTGIGLAIAKQMVELMGGEIGLESTTGKGTTFWFTVPLATETADRTSTRSAPI